MKRLVSISILLLFAACTAKEENKTESLIRLKKERADLDIKIKKLEGNPQDDTTRPAVPVNVQELSYNAFHAFIDVQGSITSDENVKATSQMPGAAGALSG